MRGLIQQGIGGIKEGHALRRLPCPALDRRPSLFRFRIGGKIRREGDGVDLVIVIRVKGL